MDFVEKNYPVFERLTFTEGSFLKMSYIENKGFVLAEDSLKKKSLVKSLVKSVYDLPKDSPFRKGLPNKEERLKEFIQKTNNQPFGNQPFGNPLVNPIDWVLKNESLVGPNTANTAIGKLEIRFEGEKSPRFGTGFLVGPNHILTACHSLFDLDDNVFPEKVIFYPFNQTLTGIGDAKGIPVAMSFVPEVLRDNVLGVHGLDIGVAVLSQSVSNSFMLPFGIPQKYEALRGTQATIAGYPVGHPNGTRFSGWELYSSRDKILEVLNGSRELLVRMDTHYGHSGSPLLLENLIEGFSQLVVGIHSRQSAYEGKVSSTFNLSMLNEINQIVNNTILN